MSNPVKHNCSCENCTCTLENHCGCFSEKGCTCSTNTEDEHKNEDNLQSFIHKNDRKNENEKKNE